MKVLPRMLKMCCILKVGVSTSMMKLSRNVMVQLCEKICIGECVYTWKKHFILHVSPISG